MPAPLATFLARALDRFASDPRLAGVAAGGSYAAGAMDEFSDLDLVVAVEPSAYDEVLRDRQSIAAGLGPLLAAFTGEHVGEPRLLICLYGPPLLHVDLKFVRLSDAVSRVEDPVVLWERDGRLTAALAGGVAVYPAPDPQWIEDRFWVWVHYGATKIGRGELFEAIDMLGFLRARVLGPLALLAANAQPNGVRKLERSAPEAADAMKRTLASGSAASCVAGLEAAADIYRGLRARLAGPELRLATAAEEAAMTYLYRIAG